MSNNIRIIYLYVVAFITLGMIVGWIVSTTYNIAEYFCPTSYIFFENETSNSGSLYDDYDFVESTSTTNSTIKKQNYKKQKIKNIVVSVVVVAVGAIMYTYHWKIIEKERNK